MEKQILAVANNYTRQYHLVPDFKGLPYYIQKELKDLCGQEAQRFNGMFQIGFYENGNVYISVSREEEDQSLIDKEFERIRKENDELFNGLRIWYLTVRSR